MYINLSTCVARTDPGRRKVGLWNQHLGDILCIIRSIGAQMCTKTRLGQGRALAKCTLQMGVITKPRFGWFWGVCILYATNFLGRIMGVQMGVITKPRFSGFGHRLFPIRDMFQTVSEVGYLHHFYPPFVYYPVFGARFWGLFFAVSVSYLVVAPPVRVLKSCLVCVCSICMQ